MAPRPPRSPILNRPMTTDPTVSVIAPLVHSVLTVTLISRSFSLLPNSREKKKKKDPTFPSISILFLSLLSLYTFFFCVCGFCEGEMQEQATSSIAASSLPSSSERSSSSALQLEVKEGMESDDEIRRVPEIGGVAPRGSVSFRETGSTAGPDRVQASSEGMRKRGRSPADKENKRLKRLLRNRVSAQQARERKKAYLTELEGRVKDLEKKNSELDERVSTLQNENQMLRHRLRKSICGNSGPGIDSSPENPERNPASAAKNKELDQLHSTAAQLPMKHGYFEKLAVPVPDTYRRTVPHMMNHGSNPYPIHLHNKKPGVFFMARSPPGPFFKKRKMLIIANGIKPLLEWHTALIRMALNPYQNGVKSLSKWHTALIRMTYNPYQNGVKPLSEWHTTLIRMALSPYHACMNSRDGSHGF
ncbi:hypothetical protein TEA_010828 [Camellia sinensis var. sinensis]|uniref:Transcription factor HY5 n=1 Tax=Camellia sinensis var. sinensis TaxID=542762 RepID=A0A4S4CYZ2_CAMSN|nr:hypothetical protein TEA_010828 [Camellia sinensis var. sinensis]